jgi:lipoic acid synthetase
MVRLPDYLKIKIAPVGEKINKKVQDILKKHSLNTVCNEARCPNKGQCYCSGTATFLIMGRVCTRNCRFCNIEKGKVEPLDLNGPKELALAVKELGLKYCVITSVTRDDIELGGAKHFAKTIEEIRKLDKSVKIEILTPDFKGDKKALDIIIEAKPDVFNHNIETVSGLYKKARPMANYTQSIEVLKYVKENSNIITKTGLMTGLGESLKELEETFKDIFSINCDILTIGQYVAPSKAHLNVEKYYTVEEFEELKYIAQKAGIKEVVSAPLARSSYKAYESWKNIAGL